MTGSTTDGLRPDGVIRAIEPFLARPTWFLRRPAMAAAARGNRGINSNIVLSDISALQIVQFSHIDRLAVAEKHHENRQADCRFCRGNGQYEEYEHLSV